MDAYISVEQIVKEMLMFFLEADDDEKQDEKQKDTRKVKDQLVWKEKEVGIA